MSMIENVRDAISVLSPIFNSSVGFGLLVCMSSILCFSIASFALEINSRMNASVSFYKDFEKI